MTNAGGDWRIIPRSFPKGTRAETSSPLTAISYDSTQPKCCKDFEVEGFSELTFTGLLVIMQDLCKIQGKSVNTLHFSKKETYPQ